MTFHSGKPAAGIPARQLDDDCRTNFVGLQTTIAFGHEFVNNNVDAQTGEHANGSAKMYAGSSDPTTKEDGSTAIDTDDRNVRLYHDTTSDPGTIKVYDNAGVWTNISVHQGMITSDELAGHADTLAVSSSAVKTFIEAQDALRLSLEGGDMTGPIAMGDEKITGLATPTAASTEAATAAYAESVGLASHFKIGTYTGDGGVTQTIDGLGFQPNFVMTWGAHNSRAAHIKTYTMDTAAAMNLQNGNLSDLTIPSFESDGFKAGSGAGAGDSFKMNQNTEVYHYIAAKLGIVS